MKATKKVSKSIVIKSAKFGKLESWDSPEPVARKVATPKRTPLNRPSPLLVQRTQGATPPQANVLTAPCVLSPEDDESDSLIKKSGRSPDRHSGAHEEDEEEDGIRRMNQGMLCILPPTVFSFIFGNDSAENL